jgi:predicted TIM-barrel fold metal-dependent hydrolase
MVHPTRDAGEVGRMVREAVGGWGFRGIKVHGHDAFPTREVCDAARAARVPILVDVFGRAELVDLWAEAYPDVPFIIPHFGSFADDWRVYQRVVDQIVRHPNVYADTSGVRQFDYLVQAVRRAGPGKVIFGSDGPWLHPGVELHKVRLLGLAPDAERAVLGGNILRLISVARPPRRRVTPYHAGRTQPGLR